MTKILKTAILLALVIANVAMISTVASAQESQGSEGDELIIYPTNLEGCFVVDMEQEAIENGGELSDGDIALRDEIMSDGGYFSLAGDSQERLYSDMCSVYPEFVNSLPDDARFDFATKFEIPPAPDGYAWAEDLTTVPVSYWD